MFNKVKGNKFVYTTNVARRLVFARLVVTDTLLAHFRSNSAHRKKTRYGRTDGRTDTPSLRVALATKNKLIVPKLLKDISMDQRRKFTASAMPKSNSITFVYWSLVND